MSAMPELYPLRFKPLLRRYLWGGRRLSTSLGKELGPGEDYAESWEIVDHGDDQSVVQHGPLAGETLSELLADYGADLVGGSKTRFPLLFKFLDAQICLSVQVHPDDTAAAQRQPPDLGKTEAWVILAAEPGSFIYAGLKLGCDRATLERQLAAGDCEECLHRIQPIVGDCYFLPAGVVHALGPGLLVAEIQQASDTTFRLYDWNRRGPDGQPRQLHLAEALDVIDFEHGPVERRTPSPLAQETAERLVQCEKFSLDRHRLARPLMFGGDGRCHILAVVEGAVAVTGDPANTPLVTGEVILLPAALKPVTIMPQPNAVVLDSSI